MATEFTSPPEKNPENISTLPSSISCLVIELRTLNPIESKKGEYNNDKVINTALSINALATCRR